MSETEETLRLLAEAWLANKQLLPIPQDPFDNYAEMVQSHLYADAGRFRSRFLKGYQVLVQELDR